MTIDNPPLTPVAKANGSNTEPPLADTSRSAGSLPPASVEPPMPAVVQSGAPPCPPLVASAGEAAWFAWEEFFYGKLRNQHTRRAYRRAVEQFLGWCERRGLELHRIAPRDVGWYLDQHPGSPSTKKQQLAALRHFFDGLVLRHAIMLNPAASVRGERYQVIEGKTPEITVEQAPSATTSASSCSSIWKQQIWRERRPHLPSSAQPSGVPGN